jgi:hypothetical protein
MQRQNSSAERSRGPVPILVRSLAMTGAVAALERLLGGSAS